MTEHGISRPNHHCSGKGLAVESYRLIQIENTDPQSLAYGINTHDICKCPRNYAIGMTSKYVGVSLRNMWSFHIYIFSCLTSLLSD